jgi:hypothetical protein
MREARKTTGQTATEAKVTSGEGHMRRRSHGLAGSTLSNPAKNLVCQCDGRVIRLSKSGKLPTKRSNRRRRNHHSHGNRGNHGSLCNRGNHRSHARQLARHSWPTLCSPCRTHRTSPGSHRRFLLHPALPGDPVQRSATVLHRRSARPLQMRHQSLRTSIRRLPAPVRISLLAFSSKSVSPVT